MHPPSDKNDDALCYLVVSLYYRVKGELSEIMLVRCLHACQSLHVSDLLLYGADA